MKKTFSKVTKLLSAIALMALTVFSDISIVNADPASSIKLGAATKLPGYIAGVVYNIKTVSGGGYAYCVNKHKAVAQNVKANYVGTMDAGIVYIIENGYPKKSFTGNKKKDFYITQGAVWWYLDDVYGTNNLTKAYKSTGSDSYGLRKYVKKLVSGAKKAKKEGYQNPSLKLEVSDKTMKKSSDGKYFVSKKIDANAKNITGKYTVKVDNAPKGTIITDVNGTKKTKFATNEKFLIKTPVSSINAGKTATISFKVGAYRTYNKAYQYQPTNGSQPVVILSPITKVKDTSLKLKATKETPKCKYDASTNTYYGKAGTKTTKENYITQCLPSKTCQYDDTYGVFYGKNGNLVSREQYENECVLKCVYDSNTNTYYDRDGNKTPKENFIAQCTPRRVCEYDATYDVYFGPDGMLINKKQYEEECIPKCKYDSNTNTYYDKNGNKTTKENYIIQCLPSKTCQYDATYNVYYGKNGNLVSKEQYINECVPKCVYDSNTNTYYDKNGNKTTKEIYIAQCTQPKACSYDSKFNVYFGKNGNIVTKEQYESECIPKCVYDANTNTYYGKTGNKVTKEEYEKQCMEPSKVTINKLDKSTNNLVSGATLVIKDTNKNVIKEFVSTATGYIVTGLASGKYTVEETKAPAGYKLNSTPVEFEIDDKDRNVSVSVYNEPISPIVTISKIDSVTLKYLPGAELLVTNQNGEEVASFTSGNESYVLKDLPYGTYTVEELSAPDGYFLNEEKYTFTIDATHLSAQVTIKNIPKTCDNGGLDGDECYVEVPNTGNGKTLFSLIGLAIASLGVGYVYKNNKANK